MQNEEPKKIKLSKEVVKAYMRQKGYIPKEKRGGRNYIAFRCPFCVDEGYEGDKTSLFFYPDTGTFKCYHEHNNETNNHGKEIQELIEGLIAENE